MIKKKNQQNEQVQKPQQNLRPVGGSIVDITKHTTLRNGVDINEAVEINAIEDSIAAVMDLLTKYLLEDENGKLHVVLQDEVPNYKLYHPYFRTIQVENGQIDRLINTKSNGEGVVPLPGCFVHFIDMHWDVGAYSIGSCKAMMRFKVVLNDLAIDTYDVQMHCYRVAHAMINCFNEHKGEYSAFTERFQLDYLDVLETWTKGIQYFWLTYQVYLHDYITYSQKHFVERHVVCPPWTNHDDQDPDINEMNHDDHEHMTYDEASNFIYPDGSEDIPIHT